VLCASRIDAFFFFRRIPRFNAFAADEHDWNNRFWANFFQFPTPNRLSTPFFNPSQSTGDSFNFVGYHQRPEVNRVVTTRPLLSPMRQHKQLLLQSSAAPSDLESSSVVESAVQSEVQPVNFESNRDSSSEVTANVALAPPESNSTPDSEANLSFENNNGFAPETVYGLESPDSGRRPTVDSDGFESDSEVPYPAPDSFSSFASPNFRPNGL
jgi:hypothetical protein